MGNEADDVGASESSLKTTLSDKSLSTRAGAVILKDELLGLSQGGLWPGGPFKAIHAGRK